MCNIKKFLVNVLRLTASLSLLFGGLGLTACNTTEGVGEDIEAAGDAIDDAAEDAND